MYGWRVSFGYPLGSSPGAVLGHESRRGSIVSIGKWPIWAPDAPPAAGRGVSSRFGSAVGVRTSLYPTPNRVNRRSQSSTSCDSRPEGGVTGQDSAARATLRRVDRISRSIARGQARSGTGRTGGRLEVALATLSADSGLRSAPTMSLPPRQRPVARRVWRLYVGNNNDVSETVRERLRLSRHLRESAEVRVRSKGCRKCVSTG